MLWGIQGTTQNIKLTALMANRTGTLRGGTCLPDPPQAHHGRQQLLLATGGRYYSSLLNIEILPFWFVGDRSAPAIKL